jgi:hypothetical protein
MTKVALPINTDLNSIYLLWSVLNNTSYEVTAYYTHLPTRKITSRFAIPSSEENKSKVESIVNWMKSNIREFTYEMLSLENYNPKWTSIQSLEIIEKVKSVGNFDKVYFGDTFEQEGQSHKDLRTAIGKVAGGDLVVEYPNRGSSLAEACITLSEELLALSSDPFISARKNMIADGKNVSDVVSKEISIHTGTHPRYGIETDGFWFIDNDEYFGTLLEKNMGISFAENYPYYRYLLEE